MSNEMAIYDVSQDMTVSRPPEQVLAEARNAAIALADVVSKKKKPVMMNGEQYLEFEDWQTVGRFYGLTAKIISTNFIDYGGVQGFEAKAVAIRGDGMEVSAAEAMCLNDEEKWSTRAKYEYINGVKTKTGEVAVPLFQLRSMAQTRACAKALRNVLAWVVVLAGYKGTPAEEIQDMAAASKNGSHPPITPPAAKKDAPPTTTAPTIKNPDDPASDKQVAAIQSMLSKYSPNTADEDKHIYISEFLGRAVMSFKDLTKGEAGKIITHLSELLQGAQNAA